MALPSLSTPKYELELTTGQKVNYRPFLVKEEKVLLVAAETGDDKDILNAIVDIIQSCTDNAVDIKTTPVFDIEYLFLNIRAKSVGEVANLRLVCPDDGKTKVDVDVTISDVKVQGSAGHEKTIKLTDQIGMVMRYPTIEDVGLLEGEMTADKIFDLIATCVDQIYDGDKIYEKQDMSKDEIHEFINSMNSKQFAELQGFFETMPKLRHTVTVKNPKTGVETDMNLEGLQSFFG